MLRVVFAGVLSAIALIGSSVHAGQVRLAGGAGSPSVIEVLDTSAFVVNSGASFWGYDITFTVPNSVTQLPGSQVWYLTGSSAVSVYKALSGTTEVLGTNLNGNQTYVPNSLEVRQNGSDMTFAVNFPNYADYEFQENDVITLLSGSYQLGTATDGIWISPGSTYSITANSISTATESSPSYSPSFVTAVPEPTTVSMSLGILACGGYSMWRRRNRNTG